MNRVPPRLVLPGTTKRDALIAIAAGLLVLAFVFYGMMQMAKPVQGNQLTGVIVGKEFTPLKERQIRQRHRFPGDEQQTLQGREESRGRKGS